MRNDITVSLSYAKMLATSLRLANPERYFLVGLFSVLDATLNRLEQLSML